MGALPLLPFYQNRQFAVQYWNCCRLLFGWVLQRPIRRLAFFPSFPSYRLVTNLRSVRGGVIGDPHIPWMIPTGGTLRHFQPSLEPKNACRCKNLPFISKWDIWFCLHVRFHFYKNHRGGIYHRSNRPLPKIKENAWWACQTHGDHPCPSNSEHGEPVGLSNQSENWTYFRSAGIDPEGHGSENKGIALCVMPNGTLLSSYSLQYAKKQQAQPGKLPWLRLLIFIGF